MTAKNFALYGGIVLLVMGLLSLLPALQGSMSGLPVLDLNVSYGMFLGMFPMNIINKLVLITVGLAGFYIGRRNDLHESVNYSKFVFFAMGALALLGIPDGTNTLGGYYPLFGSIIAVNALFALLGGYFGFFAHRVHTHSHTQHHA